MASSLATAKRILLRPPVLRLCLYLLITVYLVLCGVVFFSDLTQDSTPVAWTDHLRNVYEGYTVYLRRASLMIGVAMGIYTATLANARGLSFGLAMLLIVHWGNAVLFMAALPLVKAGSLSFNPAHYYHTSAILPAAITWILVAFRHPVGQRLARHILHH